MHQRASKCIRVHQNASNVCRMNCANILCTNLSKKWFLLHLVRGKCLNMHQNASKCIKMHQNVCRMNYSNVLCMKFQFEKFHFFGWKWPSFFLSAQNASICIRMHQNVCRMNCANVLYMKLSKQWFLSHFKRLKLTKYICHFVVENPVGRLVLETIRY